MVVEAQSFGGQPQAFEKFHSVFFEILIKFAVGAFPAEGLVLHLLELDCPESEVPWRDFIAESFADLSYAEGQLGPHGAQDIQIVHILALGIFGPQVDAAGAVVGHTPFGLEHQVELPDIRKVRLSADRTGDMVVAEEGEHFFLRHGIRIDICVIILD